MKGRPVGFAAMIAIAVVATAGVTRADDPKPIRIGDISSYSALPVGTKGYRQGWQLALEQINATGGVLGRKLEVIVRDDAGKPATAVTAANELVNSENVDLLTGTILSNIGLAVADFANQHKIFFLAAQPLTDALIWEKGNRYTFRLRPSTFTQAAILAKEAAKFPAKRWATIAPDYEFGQSAVADFKTELQKLRPDVEFVGAQWPPLGKMDAGAVLEAAMAARPEGIFNATFGSDLAKLAREVGTRRAFNGLSVVSIMTGEPEYLAPLKDDAPTGWFVTGYPWASIKTPEHQAFVDAYTARFSEPPNIGALMGYTNMLVLAKALTEAGGTQTDALIAAMEHLSLDTPVGKISFRAIDHQSTMGVYIGRLAVKDGQGVMTDWSYVNGADFQPPDAFVAEKRKP
jgi:branched-chain amino acid transport system substrate-binding protein